MLGTRLDGRYQLEAVIAAGGMGTVYLARDTRLNRLVAVKLLPATGDPLLRERFSRESGVLARLSHRNINAIYDAGEHEGRPYLILEYIEGRALSEYARGDYDVLLELLVQALRALAYAHGRGVVHRDLKPANIFVCHEGVGAQSTLLLKVLDFGVAALAKSNRITSESQVTGTPAYLSPEQATGGNVDGRSDLYSLGVVWYELITGQPPFRGDSAVSTIYQHVNIPPEPPHFARSDLPDSLERFVLTLLAKDPAQRFRTAEDALHVLDSVRQDPTVLSAIERTKQDSQPRSPALPMSRSLSDERAARVLSTFVGRHPEMDALSKALDIAASGKPQLVVVEGAGGMGKTRLLREFALVAHSRGAEVRHVHATERGASVQYGSLAALFGDQDQPHSTVDTVPKPVEIVSNIEVLQKLDALTRRAQDNIGAPTPFVAAVLSHVRTIANMNPLVMLVDDAEFLDSASVRVLRHVLFHASVTREHPTKWKLLLVVSAQDEESAHARVGSLVEAVRGNIGFRRVRLTGLADSELQEALAGAAREMPSANLTKQIAQLADGSPRQLAEVVRALTDNGQFAWDDSGWGVGDAVEYGLFSTKQELAQSLLMRLDERCMGILAQASVLGPHFDVSTVKQLGVLDQSPELDLHQHLADAVRIGIIDASQAPDLQDPASTTVRYSFTSDMYRTWLYESLSPLRRRELHRRAAQAIAQRDDRDDCAGEIALHCQAGGDADGVVTWATTAARNAQDQHKAAQAIAHVRLALSSAESLGPNSVRVAHLCMFMAELLRGEGHDALAHEQYERALLCWEQANDSEHIQRVFMELASIACAQRRHTQIEHYARRAVASSWANSDDSSLEHAMAFLAVAQVLSGDWTEALCSLGTVATLDDSDDNRNAHIRAMRHYVQGLALRQSGHLLASLSHYLVAWPDIVQMPAQDIAASVVLELARALIAVGSAGEALTRIATAYEAGRDCRSLTDDALLCLGASEAFAALEEWSKAEDLAAVTTQISGEPDIRGASYLVLARCACISRRDRDATRALEAAFAAATELGPHWHGTGALQLRIAEAWADLNKRDQCATSLQHARRFGERHQQRGLLALVRRAEGRLAFLRGEFDSAVKSAQTAHDELATLGELVEAIQTRLVIANMYASLDESHAQAPRNPELAYAAAEAEALGVETLRRNATNGLTASGNGVFPSTLDASADSFRALRALVEGLLALRENQWWLAVQSLDLATKKSAASGGALAATCQLRLAEALLGLDPPRRTDAERHLKDARKLYISAGFQDGVEEVDCWLHYAGSHALASSPSTNT